MLVLQRLLAKGAGKVENGVVSNMSDDDLRYARKVAADAVHVDINNIKDWAHELVHSPTDRGRWNAVVQSANGYPIAPDVWYEFNFKDRHTAVLVQSFDLHATASDGTKLSDMVKEAHNVPEAEFDSSRWYCLAHVFYSTTVGNVVKVGSVRWLIDNESGNMGSISINDGAKSPADPNEPTFHRLMFTAMLVNVALTFCHCKNVSTREVAPPQKRAEKYERQHGVRLHPHHVIVIDPMVSRIRTDAKDQGRKRTSMDRALHICRGHFADYTAERPLFGKLTGRFWINAHTRGTLKAGRSTHEYTVRARNMPDTQSRQGPLQDGEKTPLANRVK